MESKAPAKEALIEAAGLVKYYGPHRAVDGLNMTVHSGEIYGFLGPNGAGKTTTLRMLMGLVEPQKGSVKIDGHDIKKEPREAKAVVGFVPDRPFLYEKLTAAEFLRFLGGIYGLSGSETERRLGELLEFFDLVEWTDELVEGFSHGMKQRLTFAGALLHKPKLLIVDEPMVGLDPRGAKLIKETFRQLAAEGAGILMSTHTLEIAQEASDRIGIIREGRIIAEGNMEELQKIADTDGGRLEDIFLSLTGGEDMEQVIKILRM